MVDSYLRLDINLYEKPRQVVQKFPQNLSTIKRIRYQKSAIRHEKDEPGIFLWTKNSFVPIATLFYIFDQDVSSSRAFVGFIAEKHFNWKNGAEKKLYISEP